MKRVIIGTICAFVATLTWYLIPALAQLPITYSPIGYGLNGDDKDYSYLFYSGLIS